MGQDVFNISFICQVDKGSRQSKGVTEPVKRGRGRKIFNISGKPVTGIAIVICQVTKSQNPCGVRIAPEPFGLQLQPVRLEFPVLLNS